jgi:hypothetical protein
MQVKRTGACAYERFIPDNQGMRRSDAMADSRRKLVLPNSKKELVALFKTAGPRWMFAALVILTLPMTLLGIGFCIRAFAELLRNLR